MTSRDKPPILCLDFDGVLHSYTSGWKGADVIPDPPVPGAIQFLEAAVDRFEVHIFSSRSKQRGGIAAMATWLVRCGIDPGWLAVLDLDWSMKFNPGATVSTPVWRGPDGQRRTNPIQFPTFKPPAMVTIDDRAITFTGTWPEIDDLLAFQPWYKQPPDEAE